jgi:hypothetical protein
MNSKCDWALHLSTYRSVYTSFTIITSFTCVVAAVAQSLLPTVFDIDSVQWCSINEIITCIMQVMGWLLSFTTTVCPHFCFCSMQLSLPTHGGFYYSGAHPGKPIYFTKRGIVYQPLFSVVTE